MKTIHILLTLTSLNVLLVTAERFSFTTQIILQPYDFLRLHEVVQMVPIILFTVLIPFFLLKEVSHDFELMKSKKGLFLGSLFITGIYLYSTGNGIHELASYQFNTFCDTKNFSSKDCGSMFFNDYYFGNGLYFVGAFLMNIILLLFEPMKPRYTIKNRRDMALISINAVLYGFAIFAYAAFDRVLVGLVYSAVMMVAVDVLLLTSKKPFRQLPVTTYMALTYTLGTLAAGIVRFL